MEWFVSPGTGKFDQDIIVVYIDRSIVINFVHVALVDLKNLRATAILFGMFST